MYYLFNIFGNKKNKIEKLHPNEDFQNSEIEKLCSEHMLSSILMISKFYFLAIQGFQSGDKEKLKQVKQDCKLSFIQNKEQLIQIQNIVKEQNNYSLKNKKLVNTYSNNIKLTKTELKSFIKIILKQTKQNYLISEDQKEYWEQVCNGFTQYLNFVIHYLRTSKKNIIVEDTEGKLEEIIRVITKFQKKTIKQLKKGEISTKESLFTLTALSDTENMLNYINKTLAVFKS